MSLELRNDGSWQITSGKDFQDAIEALEQREEAVKEAEQFMEEEYDYLTMKKEIASLNEALRQWMVANHQAQVVRDDYKLVLIRRKRTKWNESKLKEILGKSMFLRCTKQVVDTDKIDDLVRKGRIDEKVISPALEEIADKPYIRRYDDTDDEGAADAELAAVKEAMGS